MTSSRFLRALVKTGAGCLSIIAQQKQFTFNFVLTGLCVRYIYIKISICSSLQSLDNSTNISGFTVILLNHQGTLISVTGENKVFSLEDKLTNRQLSTDIYNPKPSDRKCVNRPIFVKKKGISKT